jgi:hypothetical protein
MQLDAGALAKNIEESRLRQLLRVSLVSLHYRRLRHGIGSNFRDRFRHSILALRTCLRCEHRTCEVQRSFAPTAAWLTERTRARGGLAAAFLERRHRIGREGRLASGFKGDYHSPGRTHKPGAWTRSLGRRGAAGPWAQPRGPGRSASASGRPAFWGFGTWLRLPLHAEQTEPRQGPWEACQ